MLVVDDDPDIRFLVRQRLEATGKLTVVAEATTAGEAVAWWSSLRPDAVVLDLRLGTVSGLTLAAEMLGKEPDQVIVLFTGFRDRAVERQAAQAGIRATLAKTDLPRLATVLLELLEERDPSCRLAIAVRSTRIASTSSGAGVRRAPRGRAG